MACAVTPDLDKVVAKVLGIFAAITLAPIWSHRGISHSFLFALILSLLATFVAMRRHWCSEPWRTLFPMFFLVTISHAFIDVFVGNYGVALFAPFTTTRYLHPIAAIPSISFWQYFTPALGPVLLQEMLWIWFPFSALFLLIRLISGCTAVAGLVKPGMTTKGGF